MQTPAFLKATLLLSCLVASMSQAQTRPTTPLDAASDYLEPSSLWMGSTVDARSTQDFDLSDNLAIRGLVFRLGPGAYGCFDTDLMRWSMVWHGDFLSYRSMATQSYFKMGQKNAGGQTALCAPTGTPLTATGLYPGASVGEAEYPLKDPRTPGPEIRDHGRGPLDLEMGEWIGVRDDGSIATLSYKIGGIDIEERSIMQAEGGQANWMRFLEIGPHDKPLQIVLGSFPDHRIQLGSQNDSGLAVPADSSRETVRFWARSEGSQVGMESRGPNNVVIAHFSPSPHTSRTRIFVGHSAPLSNSVNAAWSDYPQASSDSLRWPEKVITQWEPHSEQGSMIQEKLPLPESNPWNRKVRSSAMVFDEDGSMLITTFDGDVWSGRPIDASHQSIEWKRVAAGLHEPMSIHLRNGEPYIFTRNGIVLLKDRDGNGEYEEHVNFCSRFTQSAETREFAMDMVLANDGSFYIAKGGQQLTYQGIDNGSVLRISPDGKTVEAVARGLRQPFLGYSSKWDMVTASDQQGHWVPSTPVHWIRDGRHYGFRPSSEVVAPSKETTEPLAWIPHRVVQSGAGQIWLGGQDMGVLNNTMVYLDHYRPRLVTVFPDQLPSPTQAAVVPLPVKFDLPMLKAAQHPVNHWLHLVGFKIWGSNASEWAGIVRLRPSGQPATYPVEVKGFKEGVLLKFAQPLDPESASNPAHYSLQRWNYKRASSYGSGYYNRQGETGTEWVGLYGAFLSNDRQSVFLATADPQPIMQMEVVFRIQAQDQTPMEGSAYFTFHQLPKTDWNTLGIPRPTLDLERAVLTGPLDQGNDNEVSAHRGRTLYETMGCMACHSTDGSTEGRVGPSFAGLLGKKRSFAKGRDLVADEAYIRESILTPPKRVVKEYAESDIGMPTYEGVLTEAQINSLIEFIKALE